MFVLKKEFADAIISVGKYRIDINNGNVKDTFVQKVISDTPSIHHMFESTEKNYGLVKSEPEPKAVSSGPIKNEV